MTSEHPRRELHSIWLHPAGPLAKLIRADVQHLSKLSNQAFFEPHVTLLGDLAGAPGDTASACQAVFAGSASIPVKVIAVSSTASFFMSLFLDLHVQQTLHEVRQELIKRFHVRAPSPFRPHISLAYGLRANQLSYELFEQLEDRYIGQRLYLTGLAVVASSSRTPIEDWKIISKQNFTQDGTGSR